MSTEEEATIGYTMSTRCFSEVVWNGLTVVKSHVNKASNTSAGQMKIGTQALDQDNRY